MITAIVGGQFGSEGKGAIAAHIAKDYSIHVRVGAANAGHTVYTHHQIAPHLGGQKIEKHVLQQLPCAAYTNPDAELVLGPGALISVEILAAEIDRNELWRRRLGYKPLSLLIDWRAHVVTPEHIAREQDTDLAARIGSTSTIAREGIGAATAARVMREAECVIAEEADPRLSSLMNHHRGLIAVNDAASFLHLRKGGDDILLEGTQGTGLSLTTGHPPYTTSRNTTASGLAADCGLGPGDIDRSIIVMRTFPIRVAGNSGPFYCDSEETTFESIGVDPERTTVTKLVRRIATFSSQQALEAVWMNRARETEIALTFADYLCPKLAGRTDLECDPAEVDLYLLNGFIERIVAATGVPVTMVGTGPYSYIRAEWAV